MSGIKKRIIFIWLNKTEGTHNQNKGGVTMKYFRILRLELAKAYIDGRYTMDEASELAQRCNKLQGNMWWRG